MSNSHECYRHARYCVSEAHDRLIQAIGLMVLAQADTADLQVAIDSLRSYLNKAPEVLP